MENKSPLDEDFIYGYLQLDGECIWSYKTTRNDYSQRNARVVYPDYRATLANLRKLEKPECKHVGACGGLGRWYCMNCHCDLKEPVWVADGK